jgi:hypothetical protein
MSSESQLSDRERNIIKVALRFYIAYDNSNPNVGWGTDFGYFQRAYEQQTGHVLTTDELNSLLKEMKPD